MIANRPPVLAHERFAADRDSFAGLDLVARFERFERIEQTNLWGATSSVSGLGSEDAATAAIREALPLLLQRLGVRSLLDAPCGDAGWIGRMRLDLDYTGIDIVPSLIAANNGRAARGELSGRFLVADITRDALPCADVVLCRDCLVHLSFDNIVRAVDRFRTSGARFLLVTTFPEWDGQSRLRGRRLAGAEHGESAVRLAGAARTDQRALRGGRWRLARQEPRAVAAG
ncbi:hypothetical protein ACVWW2_005687 [Bradyrhizobium sp. LM4.3]